MKILNQHVTIRRFLDKPVEDEVIEEILFSGTRASTTGNMQTYSLILTRDKEMKKKLAPLHFNQSVAMCAPLLITFVADFNRFSRWCQINDAVPGYSNFLSFFTAATDALLVAQNVCIAAESKGLGICYLGTTVYNAEEIIALLNMPELTFPVTTVAVGYPNENPPLTDRIPLQGVVHYEGYRNYSDSSIRELYSYKEGLEDMHQFVLENKKQTLAQVFTDIRYKKTDNEYFSDKMLRTLERQGFL